MSKSLHHSYIGTEHLLLGLLKEGTGVAAQVLREYGVEADKVLKRIGLQQGELVLTEDGLDALIDQYKNTSGIRDLEQAAEHLAANALYQIEVDHVEQVVFDEDMVRKVFA